MDPSRHLPLMFAVLDGEASPEEASELERVLADDSAARAEYEAFRNLFKKLQGIPTLDPPPGLTERFQHFRTSAKGDSMTRNKRAWLIGIATAAAAVVIVGYFFVDFPEQRFIAHASIPSNRLNYWRGG